MPYDLANAAAVFGARSFAEHPYGTVPGDYYMQRWAGCMAVARFRVRPLKPCITKLEALSLGQGPQHLEPCSAGPS